MYKLSYKKVKEANLIHLKSVINMKNFKFYGTELSQTKVTNNILRVYSKANKEQTSQNWYKEAYEFCFDLSLTHNVNTTPNKKVSIMQVAGIVAALSPLTSWERNKQLAVEFFNLARTGNVNDLKCLGLSKNKAISIFLMSQFWDKDKHNKELIKKVLGGKKTSAFFENIFHYDTSKLVTIDRHALSIALGFKLSNEQFKSHSMTKAQYQFFSDCYIKAANKLNIAPLQVQSVTWTTLRADHKGALSESKNILKLK